VAVTVKYWHNQRAQIGEQQRHQLHCFVWELGTLAAAAAVAVVVRKKLPRGMKPVAEEQLQPCHLL